MKKYLLMLMMLLSITLLCACTSKDTTLEENIDETIEEETMGLPYENKMPNELKFGTPELKVNLLNEELSDVEIIDAYLYASNISKFMNVYTLDNCDYEDKVETTNPDNGFVMEYYRSKDFNTYDDFKNYIGKVFTPELTSKLLENGSYINYDNMLYIIPAGRGTNIFALDDTYKIIKDESKITIKVATGMIDENNFDGEMKDNMEPDYYNYNNFELVYGESGWKFSSFPVIR